MYVPVPRLANSIPTKRKLTRAEMYEFSLTVANVLLYHLLLVNLHDFKKRALKQADSQGMTWQPTTKALEKWKRKTSKPIRKVHGRVGINVRYGDLIDSLTPGDLINYRYQKRANQRVRISSKSIWFETTVPYASEVDQVRFIIPDDINGILQIAIAKSMPTLRRYLSERGLLKR